MATEPEHTCRNIIPAFHDCHACRVEEDGAASFSDLCRREELGMYDEQ
jgi:hypothetical protein